MNERRNKGDSVTEGLPAQYEVVSYSGSISRMKFDTASEAAAYAKECWPDQEQDPDRTGKGWDVQVVGS